MDNGNAEYATVMRVDGKYNTCSDQQGLQDRQFVAENEALEIRLYCREMTQARGRILYEVWNVWNNHRMGILVPREITTEAKVAQTQNDASASSPARQESLRIARRTVHGCFPRLPTISMPLLTDGLLPKCRTGLTKSLVEQAVVDHALKFYTSYAIRRCYGLQSKEQAFETVIPRLRSVLASWLPEETASSNLGGFFQKHGLESKEDKEREREVPTLMQFGAAEIAGNLFIPRFPRPSIGSWA